MSRAKFAMAVVAASALFVACDDISGPGSNRDSWLTPAYGTYETCELSPAICEKIREAIDILKGMQDVTCSAIGDSAEERFEDDEDGYVSGSAPYKAYVAMDSTGAGPYGWEPVDGHVYINEDLIGNPSMGQWVNNIVGHEEQHHYGLPPNHYPAPYACPYAD